MIDDTNIYNFIIGAETEYQQPININGWDWNMKDHIQRSFYYKYGRLLNGNDETTPVKNITRPILNLQYRAEDIDVKDILIYVDDPENYHLSFLVKKYHDDVFIVENNIDTFIDDLKESKIDYGAGLAKKTDNARPEVVDLQSIAFCDQTDMMKGPIGIKHFFNPAELKDMAQHGWGDEKNGATVTLDELIALSSTSRRDDSESGVVNETPGNYIEIYEVHGVLPEKFLNEDSDSEDFLQQFHIVGFYKGEDGGKHGVTLYRKEEKESPFKIHKRDNVYSRAVGYGGAEEIFEDQVWTNYDVIHIKDMLDSASKTILKAVGAQMKSRYPNGLKDLDNLSIIELNDGEDLAQIDTTPRSMALFERSVIDWENHAQKMGGATDPLMGEPAPSGTPFRAQERQVIEGKGLHNYRRGKYAKFLEEVYRDWIIPYIATQVTKGTRFLSELSSEEMQYVADALVKNKANDFIKEEILSGRVVTEEQVELFKDKVREGFVSGGNKKFIEILEGQFKKKPLRVKINIAGKQKDMSLMTDKLVNIFRQIIANPQGFQQLMQMPELSKTFNDILEFSGISPVHYTGLSKQALPQPQQQGQPVQPQLESLQGNPTQ